MTQTPYLDEYLRRRGGVANLIKVGSVWSLHSAFFNTIYEYIVTGVQAGKVYYSLLHSRRDNHHIDYDEFLDYTNNGVLKFVKFEHE